MSTSRRSRGRCSGAKVFGCPVDDALRQNFVCDTCKTKRLDLSRCLFSRHFAFEGEDGNFICKKPSKIPVLKFTFGKFRNDVLSVERSRAVVKMCDSPRRRGQFDKFSLVVDVVVCLLWKIMCMSRTPCNSGDMCAAILSICFIVWVRSIRNIVCISVANVRAYWSFWSELWPPKICSRGWYSEFTG